MSMTNESLNALFERALDMAENNLAAAAEAAPELADVFPFAMIEASVNAAVDIAGPQDVVRLLRSFADQIAEDVQDDDARGGDRDP